MIFRGDIQRNKYLRFTAEWWTSIETETDSLRMMSVKLPVYNIFLLIFVYLLVSITFVNDYKLSNIFVVFRAVHHIRINSRALLELLNSY